MMIFPSSKHERILNKMVNYFKLDARIFAIILHGSLARGQADVSSCIDLGIFVYQDHMEDFFTSKEIRKRAADYGKMGGKLWVSSGIQELPEIVKFGNISVDILFRNENIRRYKDQVGICNDNFDVTIGNLFVNCVPLFEQDDTYKLLKKQYLPFYSEEIRKERLEGTRKEFNYRIDKAKWLAERGLLFNSLTTLHVSFTIFLQNLFIKKRVYPIYYTKWIKYQVVDILNEPELYEKLVQVFTIERLSESVLKRNANLMYNLMEEYGGK